MLLEVFLTIFHEKFAKHYNIPNFKTMMQEYFNLKYDSILEQGPTNLVERIQQAVNNLFEHFER